MKWNTIKYLCKEGFLGLWKNRLMALASIGTIVLCLLILGMSYSIAINIEEVLHQVETQIGISAYINDETEASRITAIENTIKTIPNVAEVNYISKEEALQTFANKQEDNTLFEQFKNDNPLPASFEIKVSSIEHQEAVVKKLQSVPELQVEYFKNESAIFMTINKTIQLVSSVLIGCLVVIALLLITNTIKLTVYVRRKEINIMKYLGATDSFIRLPFVIEGVLIGIIGCMLPIYAINKGYTLLIDLVGNALGSFMGGIHMVPIAGIMQNLVPMFILISVGIGVLGSVIAIRKHLKV